MLANYLIGLREGLEAALVVSILVAYLVRTDNRAALRPLWAGVAVAVGASLAAGAVLTFTSRSMSHQSQELFDAVASLAAVGFVTWMIFWMRRTSHHLKGDLQGKLGTAIAMGTGAIFVTALLAVGREGLETALFVWTAVQATGSTISPVAGAALGLATAVALAYLLYRRAVQLNLAKFFRYTGAALVVVAAGVLAYSAHDFQEAGHFTAGVLGRTAFDATGALPPSSWWGSLFKGLFAISAKPSWLEFGVWVAYLVPTMALFLRRPKSAAPKASTSNETAGAPSRRIAVS